LKSTVWIGLLGLVAVIGNGIAIIWRQRRSGKVQSYGHPKQDFLLLLTSGLILVVVMVLGFWVLGDRATPKGLGAFLGMLLLVAFASGLTVVSNKILRRKPKR
jgi:hypothetical protein